LSRNLESQSVRQLVEQGEVDQVADGGDHENRQRGEQGTEGQGHDHEDEQHAGSLEQRQAGTQVLPLATCAGTEPVTYELTAAWFLKWAAYSLANRTVLRSPVPSVT
jgi:hypothetical protein